jgi:hypothetical protein
MSPKHTHAVVCLYCDEPYEFSRKDFGFDRVSGWFVTCPHCESTVCGDATDAEGRHLEALRKAPT